MVERLAEQTSVDLELLRLIAKQGRRVPYPVGLAALALALMSMSVVHGAIALGWLAAVYGVLALRWWLLGQLPEMHERPLQQRLNWAVGLSLLNGMVFSASLGVAPWLSDFQRMVQTIVLLGLCAGAVATTAGHRVVFQAFLWPVTIANALAWGLGHDAVDYRWLDWVLSGLIVFFGLILMSLARDTYRVFAESVLIRQQQVKNNQQLRQALAQAESAMAAKTRFLASASHDLRQPMHTLSLFGAALAKRPLDGEGSVIVTQMNLALQSLSSQMDALLDISKLDAQVVPVNNQVFALQPWLGRLQREFQPAAHRKQLLLRLDCPPDACVESDPVLLERVVRNLIDNAIKYTQRGEVSIEVSRGQDDGIWRLSVRDTGVGIPEHEQSRVFDEFYQVGNPERDRAKGLGLGLSIVNRLVDLLDLHLALRSAPGHGSSFMLNVTAADPSEIRPDQAPRHGPSLPPIRVLVIDDEEPVRVAMQALLSAHGCQVLLAGSTREGLLKSMGQQPDLLLTDFRLRSGEDGISAVRSIRSAFPGLPALLVSGDTAPERLREAHEAGLTLLHKPVTEEQLINAMQAALAEQRREVSDGTTVRGGAASPA
ncbi:ATP-binding response regulator [Roseateles amylovorans]|jgi:signal transduction histidine kinase/ActR/RegA family two-component response regulator|uniref:histidine kinase n=1 Tax=Roseateles amylovorans TaxID=2978473 RepID=A0ABY6B2T9_9BURK|nr:hybrid sensor histidine kinase/response regulator [Roseateles amylovorans]UXH78853.1 hybrid sensor histidine kinase/response regulator [Roseateles amylovorans]